MPAIATFAVEGARRGALDSVARAQGTLIDGTHEVAALRRLLERCAIDLVVADGIEAEELGALVSSQRSTRFILLAPESDAVDLVLAGAAAVLPREADAAAIGAAIALTGSGLRLLPAVALDHL